MSWKITYHDRPLSKYVIFDRDGVTRGSIEIMDEEELNEFIQFNTGLGEAIRQALAKPKPNSSPDFPTIT